MKVQVAPKVLQGKDLLYKIPSASFELEISVKSDT